MQAKKYRDLEPALQNGFKIIADDLDPAISAFSVVVAPSGSGYLADYYTDGFNDEIQIQAAIDAVPLGGGTVLLRRGEYYIYSSLVLKDYVVLTGEGYGTKLYGVGSGFSVVEGFGSIANPVTDFELSNLMIDGTQMVDEEYNTDTKGVYMHTLTRAKFKNLYIYNTPATGLGVDFLVDSVIENVIAENCGRQWEIGGYGGNGIGIGTGKYANESLQISSCHAINNGNNGIMFEQQGIELFQAKYLHVVNCHSYGNGTKGFRDSGSARIKFVACTSFDNSEDGFYFDTSGLTSGTYKPKEIIIEGSHITNNGGDGVDFSNAANDSQIYSLVGNHIAENGGNGVNHNGSGRLTFDANQIYLNVQNGVRISSGAGSLAVANIIFSSNQIFDNGSGNVSNETNGVNFVGSGTSSITGVLMENNNIFNRQGVTDQDYAIRVNHASDNNLMIRFTIKNNDLTGNAISALSLGNHDNFIVRNNRGVDRVTALSTNTTLNHVHDIVTMDATGGNRTLTLRPAARMKDTVYFVKKIDSSGNTVTIDGNSTETIDGAETKVLSNQWEVTQIISDGTRWYVL